MYLHSPNHTSLFCSCFSADLCQECASCCFHFFKGSIWEYSHAPLGPGLALCQRDDGYSLHEGQWSFSLITLDCCLDRTCMLPKAQASAGKGYYCVFKGGRRDMDRDRDSLVLQLKLKTVSKSCQVTLVTYMYSTQKLIQGLKKTSPLLKTPYQE